MDFHAFALRFKESQEIGRDLTDEQLCIYYDNSQDVGVWREDRRTTLGRGEVLSPDNAIIARDWFGRQKTSVVESPSRGRSR